VHRRANGLVPPALRTARADHRDPRFAAEPREAAARLPLQPALPALRRPRRGALHPADDRAAPAARGRAGPPRRLPPGGPVSAAAAALEVRGLSKDFGHLRAVDDVSFALRRGVVTALVGESGSGKSTVARLLSRLYLPTAGTISFHGEDVSRVRGRRALLAYRSEVQMIFQDPFASLNPVKRVQHHLER